MVSTSTAYSTLPGVNDAPMEEGKVELFNILSVLRRRYSSIGEDIVGVGASRSTLSLD